MDLPSKLLNDAVYEISQLPGIGKKTALRLALHLLRQPEGQTNNLSASLIKLRKDIKYCKSCHNISDADICKICSSARRDNSIICVVEDVRDVMAIENTAQFNGIYHVLGGKISPMDGIGPQNLNIDALIKKAQNGDVKEIIFALSSTMEGDTTIFFIYRQIKNLNISTSTIARGISIGDELEYADEITLGRSIINRIPYEQTFERK